MNWTNVAIGVWCFIAAAIVGWLLFKLERRATRSLDTHVDTALAMVNARERHPATRNQGPPPVGRVCGRCYRPIPFGPLTEHICRGTR